MIITEVFYGVKCNRCGELYEDGEHSFYTDEGYVMELAYENEWVEHKGKHYCPDCYEKNEDGDFVTPKAEYPKSVEVVKQFLKTILKNAPRTIERDDTIEVRCYESYGETLPCDIEWLKLRLGENLTSIERRDLERCRSKEVVITLKN